MLKKLKYFLILFLVLPTLLVYSCSIYKNENSSAYGRSSELLTNFQDFVETNDFHSKEDFQAKFKKLKYNYEKKENLKIYDIYDPFLIVNDRDFYFEVILDEEFLEINLLEAKIKMAEPINRNMGKAKMEYHNAQIKFDILNKGIKSSNNFITFNNDAKKIDLGIENLNNWDDLNFDFYYEKDNKNIITSTSQSGIFEIAGNLRIEIDKNNKKAYLTALNNGGYKPYKKLMIWTTINNIFLWTTIKLTTNKIANKQMKVELSEKSIRVKCNQTVTNCINFQDNDKLALNIYIDNLSKPEDYYSFSLSFYQYEDDIFGGSKWSNPSVEISENKEYLELWFSDLLETGKIIVASNFDLNMIPLEIKMDTQW